MAHHDGYKHGGHIKHHHEHTMDHMKHHDHK
jgi:hypothetical protein